MFQISIRIRMTFSKLVKEFSSKPRRLFLIDGLGAILSAFLLGVVLVQLEYLFGVPRSTLYFLAFLPCLFALYDLYCYQRVNENLSFHLKVIACFNILYCGISIGLACFHYQKITYLVWVYFVIEVIIVIAIAKLELKVAANISNQENDKKV
ncbi:MAG: hypothetical protein ACI9RM_000898 [Ulvibacter sp.]|jgi:hypothetical protein